MVCLRVEFMSRVVIKLLITFDLVVAEWVRMC